MKKILFLCVAVITMFVFFSCNQFNDDIKLIPVKSGEKWGYIDKKGEYVINPQFVEADFFRDGLAKVVSSDGKTGYINIDGKYAIPAKFKNGTPFIEGLAFVVSDGGYITCIDKSGETKFTLKQAEYVHPFSEGLATIVTIDKENKVKIGFIDKSGKVTINPQFEKALPFSEGLAAVVLDYKWGFIDKTGKIAINQQFEHVLNFTENKAASFDGKKWGYIDKKGTYIINPQFNTALPFSEGLAAVQQGDVWGYVNGKGQIVINPQFKDTFPFSEGLAAVKQDDNWGFINKEGKYIINPQFDNALFFYGNIAPVRSVGKIGFIDKKGKYIINPQFDEIPSDNYLTLTKTFKVLADHQYIRSDYYDAASTFINKFFERADNNSLDGFTANSILQDIVDNPLYDNAYADDKYIVHINDKQVITDDISITKVQFHFTNPIYDEVSTYNDRYSSRYKTGTRKQYSFNENIAAIEYKFDLSGTAVGKGSAVANALKIEIENRYKVKMESKNRKYSLLQDKLSFVIVYSHFTLELYVGWDKETITKITS